jgi:hypothetical protein
MSLVCNVVGAVPVGALIVGAEPALAVTVGNPVDDAVSATFAFPPHAAIDVSAIAITAAMARFLIFEFMCEIYQEVGYKPSKLIIDLASAV